MEMRVPILLGVLFISGCASDEPKTPATPYLAGDIVEVPENGFGKYWVPHRPAGIPSGMPGAGCIRIQVIIDSNGHLFNPKLLALDGPPGLYPWTLKLISTQKFTPAPENTRRVPIQTEFTWWFGKTTEVTIGNSMGSAITTGGNIGSVKKSSAACAAVLDKQMDGPNDSPPPGHP